MVIEIDIYDFEKLHYFLSFEANQSNAKLYISQKKYAQEIFKMFHMMNCNSVSILTKFGF